MKYKKNWDIPKVDLANMVYAGFRDPRRDIQDPPLAQSDPCAAPDPYDEEHMDSRPHKEGMEEAINNFLLLLEKQEKKGLATILSKLPKPTQGSDRSMSMTDVVKAGFPPNTR